jgi:hypothetical protein
VRSPFDFSVPVGLEEGNQAFFGRDVLQGLVDGIGDFVAERQPRWERDSYRVGAPHLLGCSPWVNDGELLDAIEKLPGACVVVSKQPRNKAESITFQRLRALNENTGGIALHAFSGLADMAPKVDGQPRVIGPYDTIHEEEDALETFRAIGYI